MVTFEECADMLDEIADSMPSELFRDLNAGMSLVPQAKVHPQSVRGELYILGEYIRNSIGNSIVFYYGSIMKVYGSLPADKLYTELERIMHHEVKHHNEHLAGCDDLGICDDEQIVEYLRKNGVNG